MPQLGCLARFFNRYNILNELPIGTEGILYVEI